MVSTMGKVALQQVFLAILQFPLPIIGPAMLLRINHCPPHQRLEQYSPFEFAVLKDFLSYVIIITRNIQCRHKNFLVVMCSKIYTTSYKT